jgi:drug/metabolite transporter (DMT)-like permease
VEARGWANAALPVNGRGSDRLTLLQRRDSKPGRLNGPETFDAVTPLALALSIACGLALSGADYFRKAVPASVPTATLLFFFIAGQIPLLGLWLAGDPRPEVHHFAALGTAAYWRPGLLDAAISLCGNALFIVAVRRSPIGLVIPLLALLPVFALLLGGIVLGEWPGVRQGSGIALTAAGIFLVYQPSGVRLSPLAVWRNFRAERGTLPMLGVAVAWSATAPLDKLALAQAGFLLHAVIQVAALTIAIGVWLIASSLRRGTMRDGFYVVPAARRIVVAAAVCAGLSYGLQLAAYQVAFVAFVEALKRGVEIATVLLVAALVLREPVSRYKMIGLLCIIGGLPMMILPA